MDISGIYATAEIWQGLMDESVLSLIAHFLSFEALACPTQLTITWESAIDLQKATHLQLQASLHIYWYPCSSL